MMARKRTKRVSGRIKGKIRPKRQLPTFLTMVNAILGFISIILIFNQRYDIASLLIITAFIFDILDGMLARKLQATSDFGAELDSLADTISFVIAPALLIYFVFFDTQRFGLIAGVVAVICGISRLAKFNITKDNKGFIGLPTPMFALVTVSFVFLGIKIKEEIALLLFFLLSYLMVSHLKYPSFKEKSMARYKYAGIILLISMIITLLLKIDLSYIAIGVNVYLWMFIGLPLMFSRYVKRKKKLTLFYLGMILATIAFYQEAKMLLVLPFIYTVIAGWLVQSALTSK